MRTIVIAIIILVLSAGVLRAQSFNPDFLKCAVYISFNPTPQTVRSGTGFFVWRALGTQKGQVFLLTNKHLLPQQGKQQSIKMRVTGSSKNVQEVDIPIIGSDGKYLPTVFGHTSQAVDVVAVNVTEQVIQYDIPGKWLDFNLFVTKENLLKENISAGDDVFILGYPNAIYDPRTITPITRVGIIATVPSQGFGFNDELKSLYGFPDELDGFLIDANVFPGSSGSLVILKQQSSTINGSGEVEFNPAKRRPYLLGIVSSSLPINDTALGSRVRMGLGFAYSATVVRQTIEQSSKVGPTVQERGIVGNISLSENAPGEVSLQEPTTGRWISWKVGKGLPTGTCISGSVYSRTDGGTGSTLYVCENSTWVAK